VGTGKATLSPMAREDVNAWSNNAISPPKLDVADIYIYEEDNKL